MRIYLDVCCLCRPFDNQQNRKIRLESEAINSILERCSRDWQLAGSVVIDEEISRLANIEKRLKVEQNLAIIGEYIELDEEILKKAAVFQKAGLRYFDALHLACAERGQTIFLTTDNKIITIARKIPVITIRVDNPVHWLLEVSAYENNK